MKRTVRDFWWMGGASVDPGLLYLQENARIFYDFTTLTGADGSAITSVNDLSPNGRNLEGSGSPVVKDKQIDGITYKTAETYTDSNPTRRVLQLATASHANNVFNSSFEIFATFMLEDGQPATTNTMNYWGIINGVNRNASCFRQNYSTPNYFLNAFYFTDSAKLSSYGWSTANGNPFIDGPMGQTLVRIKWDFENDIFLLQVNGVGGTYTMFTNITNITDASSWTAGTYKFCIGSINDNGTILVSATNRINWLRFAVTPILTSQQVTDVSNYLLL